MENKGYIQDPDDNGVKLGKLDNGVAIGDDKTVSSKDAGKSEQSVSAVFRTVSKNYQLKPV